MKKLLLALCATLLITPHAFARDSVLDIQEVTSTGGIKAWLVEDHSLPIIALNFAFKNSGAAQDPADKQGLARLASNTMDEGAGKLDSHEFQKTLKDLSISLSFNSDRDTFGGQIKTLSKNKKRAFELLRLALSQPRFDEEPVERMKNANISRILSSLPDPGWIAARISNDKAYEGHPYAHNSGGTLTTLKNITRDDLVAFSQKLSKDNLIISASGDISPTELSRILDYLFAPLPETSPYKAPEDLTLQNQGKTYLFKNDTPQTIIEILQPGIDNKDPQFQHAQVMNFILGSSGFGTRLMEEVREKRGLTYGIYSNLDSMVHFNGLSVSTSTKNETVGEVLEIIKTEWDKMKNTPITEQELKSAKSYLIGALPLSLTSTDQIANLLLTLQISDLPIDYLDKREADIEEATIGDVENVAKRLLNSEQFVTVLVGQPKNIRSVKLETVEKLPNVE